ncbi:MAG: peptidase M14 [Candidatus Eisenbacteria bacterium]|uniref:Peptidase M14 n=1 Tax=Eiseniibacteriota bacterium TaxID=2212470 RepID=A0A849SJ06_UNCEI|nr:peptidase M14 [Candidatus Eisenbacteria bacterium]
MSRTLSLSWSRAASHTGVSIALLAALALPGRFVHAQPAPPTAAATASIYKVEFAAPPDSVKPGTSVTSTGVAPYWLTKAERSGYRQTPSYDETIRFCRQLTAGSQNVRYLTYGVSGQGRELPLLVLSRDRAFTPAAAIATGKPIVLIQNGIHSGEIEGKDACLALARDILVTRTRERLLDSVIVLILPIFSVDAHERTGPWNRINQNGPESMGWRASPIGLNMNRDYMKVETPEMQALLSRVFTQWWPHLLVDNHTTNGADYQHDLTYSVNHGPVVPRPIERWMTHAVSERIIERTRAMGHLPAPYLSFKDGSDPRSGIVDSPSAPRFSTGYPPLHGRAAILTETHMLKPYANRVKATYDFMVAILEELNARPRELARAVAESEAEIVTRGREAVTSRRDVVLATTSTDSAESFPYRGVETRWETSPITGASVPHFGTAPWDTLVPLYQLQRPTVVVRQPAGYVVPQEWRAVREKLELHGVRVRRLTRAWTDSVEIAHILEAPSNPATFEGHRPLEVKRVQLERVRRSFRAGDLWVALDQPQGLVAMHLLEAQAPDGLLAWNYFDTIFQRKEYAEDYVMEPIAKRMMEADPALADSFRVRLIRDPAFAKDAGARTDFFYRRSPWADPEQDRHPIARALRRPPESVFAP